MKGTSLPRRPSLSGDKVELKALHQPNKIKGRVCGKFNFPAHLFIFASDDADDAGDSLDWTAMRRAMQPTFFFASVEMKPLCDLVLGSDHMKTYV